MATNPGQLAGVQAGLSELRSRLLFVLFALLVYRIGTHIPLPGINPERLAALFSQQQGGILDLHTTPLPLHMILERPSCDCMGGNTPCQ